MRISDWSSDVCSSDLLDTGTSNRAGARFGPRQIRAESCLIRPYNMATRAAPFDSLSVADIGDVAINTFNLQKRSEEHTSELQSLMRISYAVFCLKKKNNKTITHNPENNKHTTREQIRQ